MVSRLNGRTSHAALAGRVLALEAVLDSVSEEEAAERALHEAWERLPLAVCEYLAQYPYPDDWVASMHPRRLADLAFWALDQGEDVLTVVCGEVLRHAWCTLDWWHARDLRPQRGTTTSDAVTRELAAQELFGVDSATLHRLWSEDRAGVEWVRLWRESTLRPVNGSVLEHAGLGEAELELLDN